MSGTRHLWLRQLPEVYAICRLSGDTSVPSWATGGTFSSVTHAPGELSVICSAANVPETLNNASRGWTCLMLEGPFELTEVGVLASIAGPLAEARVSIFVMSTFDTDYLLVKQESLLTAIQALQAQGCEIIR